MSEHKDSSSVLSFIGALAIVGIFAAVLMVAYGNQLSDTKPTDTALRERRVSLRLEVEGASKKLISEYGKNDNGTYRIPADKARELLVSDTASALAAARGVK